MFHPTFFPNPSFCFFTFTYSPVTGYRESLSLCYREGLPDHNFSKCFIPPFFQIPPFVFSHLLIPQSPVIVKVFHFVIAKGFPIIIFPNVSSHLFSKLLLLFFHIYFFPSHRFHILMYLRPNE